MLPVRKAPPVKWVLPVRKAPPVKWVLPARKDLSVKQDPLAPKALPEAF